MDGFDKDNIETKKRIRPTTRQFNTAVFILRAIQIGLRIDDLYIFTFGEVMDLVTEAGNDREQYDYKATEQDIRRLFG